jgi:FAD-dependent urate hydroxylase
VLELFVGVDPRESAHRSDPAEIGENTAEIEYDSIDAEVAHIPGNADHETGAGEVRTVVVGAGVGGLSVAHGLRANGHEVVVIEEAPALRTSGAAVSIWFNGAAALTKLGVSLDGIGARIDRLEQRTVEGRVMFSLDAARLARRFGVAAVTVPRRLLQRLAVDVERSLLFGRRVHSVQVHGHGAAVELDDGEVVDADLVIGADGARSVVRSVFRSDGPAVPTGWVAFQGLSALPLSLADTTKAVTIVGDGGYFGLMPAGDGLLQWWFHHRAPPKRPSGDLTTILRDRYRAWPGPVPQLLEAITEADVEYWPYVRHRVPRTFVGPRVALIGDAVHAMPPSLAQGASLTLEDAWVLNRELAAAVDPEGALRSYQRERRWRVAVVSALAGTKTAQDADRPWLRWVTPSPAALTWTYGRCLRAVSSALA